MALLDPGIIGTVGSREGAKREAVRAARFGPRSCILFLYTVLMALCFRGTQQRGFVLCSIFVLLCCWFIFKLFLFCCDTTILLLSPSHNTGLLWFFTPWTAADCQPRATFFRVPKHFVLILCCCHLIPAPEGVTIKRELNTKTTALCFY